MALKDCSVLQVHVLSGTDIPIRLCGHIERDRFDISTLSIIFFHDACKRCEHADLLDCVSCIEMVDMAFTGHIRVRRKDDIRPEVADDFGNLLFECLVLVEASV